MKLLYFFKKHTIIIVVFFIALIASFYKGYFSHSGKDGVSHERRYRIAVVVPVSHPALEEIQLGFVETMQKNNVAVECDFYNGNGDMILLKGIADTIFASDYDLICPIATPAALLCVQTAKQKNSNVPLVCCGADDILINAHWGQKSNYAVVNDASDFKKQIEVLVYCHPSVRTIILPYESTPGLEAQVQVLKNTVKNYYPGIMIKSIPIFSENELYAQVNTVVDSKDDVIMVLKDNKVVSCIESLINIAAKKNVLLYASDLNSVDKGACMGFGVSEYSIGACGAEKAIIMLQPEYSIGSLPTTYINNFSLKINAQQMKAQGLVLNSMTHFLIQSAYMIDKRG